MFTQAHRYPGLPFSSGQQCRRSGLGANGAPRAAYPTLGSLPHSYKIPSSRIVPSTVTCLGKFSVFPQTCETAPTRSLVLKSHHTTPHTPVHTTPVASPPTQVPV